MLSHYKSSLPVVLILFQFYTRRLRRARHTVASTYCTALMVDYVCSRAHHSRQMSRVQTLVPSFWSPGYKHWITSLIFLAIQVTVSSKNLTFGISSESESNSRVRNSDKPLTPTFWRLKHPFGLYSGQNLKLLKIFKIVGSHRRQKSRV